MEPQTTHTEARRALDTIEESRRQVIAEIDMPAWYWWGLAVGWVGLGIVADLGYAWVTAFATLLFGTVHSTVSARVAGGRHRTDQLRVRADVVGRHAQLLVIAGLVVLAGVTVGGALAVSADGARHPVTIASVVVALLVLAGGPRLMAGIRRAAARASSPS